MKIKSWITYPIFGNPITIWKRVHAAEKAVHDLPGYKEAYTEFRRPYVGFMIMILVPIFILFGVLQVVKILGYGPFFGFFGGN